MSRAFLVLAGASAIASGLAYLAYPLISGGPEWAITAWNLLIIPAILVLGIRLSPGRPALAAAATAAGLLASILWAFDFARPSVEPWWIGLAAIWWLGIGALMLSWRRRTAWLTIALGVATAVDLVVTLADVGLPLLAVGGFKVPLTNLWSLVIGVVLLRAAMVERDPLPVRQAAGPMAIAGGVVWAAGGAGWLLTHGIQTDPVTAELMGLRGTQFTQLFVVATLLWAVALLPLVPGRGRAVRVASAVSLLGVAMVGLGALLETSIVDPDLFFRHPAVQAGWLLFIGGLFPVLCAGMLGFALVAAVPRRERAAFAAVGACAPLPVVAFLIGAIGASGSGAVAALVLLHAAPGIGWIVLGLAWRQAAGVWSTAGGASEIAPSEPVVAAGTADG